MRNPTEDQSRPSPFRLTTREQERFERALAAIDAVNSADPNWIWVRGRERPKELAHGQLATEWVERLCPRASLELRLAARAHHLRRWVIPRSENAPGRSGYLRWRKRLQSYHAEQAGILLAGECYPEDTILRVQALIRKRGLGQSQDREVQTLEDALCLIFLETQLADLARRTPSEKLRGILLRTREKMSLRAIELCAELPVDDSERKLLQELGFSAALGRQRPEDLGQANDSAPTEREPSRNASTGDASDRLGSLA